MVIERVDQGYYRRQQDRLDAILWNASLSNQTAFI